MHHHIWQFAIDVGGTFCDVVAHTPDGRVLTHKLLSSGRTKGVAAAGSGRSTIIDPRRRGDPDGFWDGFRCVLLDAAGDDAQELAVAHFEAASGMLRFDNRLSFDIEVGTRYELRSRHPAPILAIRYLLKLGGGEPLPRCTVRFGTTQATNALLERRGARTALVITEGFGDLLTIGDQSRPALFDLNIRKPPPLIERSVEVRERVDAAGRVLTPLDHTDAIARLEAVRRDGVESLAICLLNAYRNPAHEEALARLARDVGFDHVSTSAALSPTQRILHRAENCVVDAYLSPAFRDTVRTLDGALPGGSLRLMTGAGGLVSAERFTGSTAIMSGPAGGLVGAVESARRAGVQNVIAFDMGGTSTDVARYDGAFEYQHGTRRAGVRIVTPMLAIETVAAGGGSVCSFDGTRFLVGPRSAGTDPGPACYGRGGPLTLTDVNLFLGRIAPDRFPFPLDLEAVADRIDRVIGEVTESGHRTMTRDAVAEGFVAIANETMAAAVKRITIERGIDARDYTLVCFGGAGGQHACAVARSLGIDRVLVPAAAGVLSAYGIAMADLKRFAERPVHATCSDALLAELECAFRAMERDVVGQLRDDGVPENDISCARTLDMRYAGQGVHVTVAADDCLRRFERMHRRRYGYVHTHRDVEIVAARVEGVGRTVKPDSPSEPRTSVRAGADFETGALRATVDTGDAFHPGDTFDGPAIVAAPTHTIVVARGWRAEVSADGDIVIRDAGARVAEKASTEADPVRVELFNNHFAAIAEQMGTSLRRTALSTNVKERLDFSCALFDRAGDLIANAPHIPVHLGSMAACVKCVIEDVGEFHPGDCVVTNDPFRGGTHLPDVTVVTPVFVGDAVAFFVASRAHHAEIGGVRPGSMPPDSTHLAEEGVRIPCFKLIDAGHERFDAVRAMLAAPPYPSRAPDENIADIIAQTAANQTGAQALSALVHRYGEPVVSAFTRHVRSAAEKKMQQAIGNLPDGTFQRRVTLDDGTAIQVRITVDGPLAVVDFTGTASVHPGQFNATRAIVTSAVLYCFRCLIDDDIPLNAGVLTPIRLVVPRGLLDPPADPDPGRCPAVAGGNVETSQRIVDAVFGALGVVAASQGTMNNLTFGHDRFSYYETICGGAGAGPTFPGADAVHTHMTNTRMTDPEVLEARYPVRLRRFAVRPDSGGRGRHRGGDGCVREIEFLESLDVSLITQRRTTRPYGVDGGQPGAAGRNTLIRSVRDAQAADCRPVTQTLPAIGSVRVHAGDRLIIETPGGGGWGTPSSA